MRPLCALLAVITLVGFAAPVAAQITPGYKGDHDRARAEFRAYALNGFQTGLSGWVQAVNADDAEAAAGFYTDNAFVHLAGPAENAEDLRTLLEQWLDSVDGVRVGLQDFDASGSMAYGSVRVQFVDSESAARRDGVMAIAMLREGRRWAIRSQTLLVYPE